MLFRKSAGAVVFYQEPQSKEIQYLLLLHPKGESEAVRSRNKNDYRERDYWNFPKGTIEDGEAVFDTAKREVQEETGLEGLDFLPGFKTNESYIFRIPKDYHHKEKAGQLVFKKVIFYLAESKSKDIKISTEHIGYEWLNFKDAFERLNRYKGSQKVLVKADKFLHKK